MVKEKALILLLIGISITVTGCARDFVDDEPDTPDNVSIVSTRATYDQITVAWNYPNRYPTANFGWYELHRTEVTANFGISPETRIATINNDVPPEAFITIVAGTVVTSEEIWLDLKSKGYLDSDNKVTEQFDPQVELQIYPLYHVFEKNIRSTLQQLRDKPVNYYTDTSISEGATYFYKVAYTDRQGIIAGVSESVSASAVLQSDVDIILAIDDPATPTINETGPTLSISVEEYYQPVDFVLYRVTGSAGTVPADTAAIALTGTLCDSSVLTFVDTEAEQLTGQFTYQIRGNLPYSSSIAGEPVEMVSNVAVLTY